MIIGRINQAKSFMFMLMWHIYDCFTCPSDSKFKWAGATEKEVIFLNNFWHNDGTIWWKLKILQGVAISVSMSKNHFSSDVNWTEHQPIFATAKEKILRAVNNNIDESETSHMDERWTYIQFCHKFIYGEIELWPSVLLLLLCWGFN